ncbi:hypothetical protein UVI_02010620 [Ustilaginoidea virens]|uniref:Uncharacterized protein n=1 Tax=Ustilaginoidea virens TaxID=1159556 RepID=A0A1B5KWI1_USTVR|nr:hypothetical protein UVI_02010620 [Ustilaginoidea virens]
MGLPIHVYPLYENGRRAHRGQSARENTAESAGMYAAFDKIASENPCSWNYQQPPKTAELIATRSRENRMICDPYPLLMNAFNGVNLSAACVLTSAENARRLGIPPSKWVYVLGGAGTRDKDNCKRNSALPLCSPLPFVETTEPEAGGTKSGSDETTTAARPSAGPSTRRCMSPA